MYEFKFAALKFWLEFIIDPLGSFPCIFFFTNLSSGVCEGLSRPLLT